MVKYRTGLAGFTVIGIRGPNKTPKSTAKAVDFEAQVLVSCANKQKAPKNATSPDTAINILVGVAKVKSAPLTTSETREKPNDNPNATANAKRDLFNA